VFNPENMTASIVLFDYQVGLSEIMLILLGIFVIILVSKNIFMKEEDL